MSSNQARTAALFRPRPCLLGSFTIAYTGDGLRIRVGLAELLVRQLERHQCVLHGEAQFCESFFSARPTRTICAGEHDAQELRCIRRARKWSLPKITRSVSSFPPDRGWPSLKRERPPCRVNRTANVSLRACYACRACCLLDNASGTSRACMPRASGRSRSPAGIQDGQAEVRAG